MDEYSTTLAHVLSLNELVVEVGENWMQDENRINYILIYALQLIINPFLLIIEKDATYVKLLVPVVSYWEGVYGEDISHHVNFQALLNQSCIIRHVILFSRTRVI